MADVDVLRTEQINLKLTPEELERLKRMASAEEITPQAMLRLLLKRAAAETRPAKPSRKR